MPTSSNKDSVTINGTFFYTMQKAASLLNFKSVRSLSRLVNRRKIRYTRLMNRPLRGTHRPTENFFQKDRQMKQTSLDFSKKTVIYMDEEMYTTLGATEAMGISKASLSSEIKAENIEVFRHPGGNLFSLGAIQDWRIRRTQRVKKK